ncbi:hypothetical protein [Sphingomonas sp. ID0503]|uniref:hypothetical protein n=1 Tax=Sphingomonas sp. ID0503 TaxID=3399691 RepID=UPI003AFA34A7
MILIPDLKTVVILTPRTGTRSLKRAIAERYPESMMLYRHMEADGVPHGYDRWRKVGVVRNPIDRLWSLYNYLQHFGINFAQEHDTTYTARMRASVGMPFEAWLLNNEAVFTSPYDSAGLGRFFPAYACRHPLPENRKSQFIYLRPDLGTSIYRYREIGLLHDELGVDPVHTENATGQDKAPALSETAMDYVRRWFAWDMGAAA